MRPAEAAPARADSPANRPSAIPPARRPRSPKNWRRVCISWDSNSGFMRAGLGGGRPSREEGAGSVPGQRLVEVEQGVGHERVGGQLDLGKAALRRRLADVDDSA